MAQTPKRPVIFRFIVGRGQTKRRQESEDTTRAIVEQASISFANDAWEEIKDTLANRITSDVRAELVNVAAQFRRNVIGAPGTQRGLVGTLRTKTQGSYIPSASLSSLPRWAPRGAAYLRRKARGGAGSAWFDNSGWAGGGTLSDFFASKTSDTGGGTEVQIGSGGVLEDVFGGISVQITRNNKGWGVNQGTITVGRSGVDAQVQLATIRVRALGKVTERMLQISDQPNTQMLDAFVAAGQRDVALHLRGGRGVYRPTLEPYLKFFLTQAIPQAVTERVRKGTANGSLFRKT